MRTATILIFWNLPALITHISNGAEASWPN